MHAPLESVSKSPTLNTKSLEEIKRQTDGEFPIKKSQEKWLRRREFEGLGQIEEKECCSLSENDRAAINAAELSAGESTRLDKLEENTPETTSL